MKNKIIKIFQNVGLRITVETSSKSVNFLDVNLDLKSGIHKPYMKPNNNPVYVHAARPLEE